MSKSKGDTSRRSRSSSNRSRTIDFAVDGNSNNDYESEESDLEEDLRPSNSRARRDDGEGYAEDERDGAHRHVFFSQFFSHLVLILAGDATRAGVTEGLQRLRYGQAKQLARHHRWLAGMWPMEKWGFGSSTKG